MNLEEEIQLSGDLISLSSLEPVYLYQSKNEFNKHNI